MSWTQVSGWSTPPPVVLQLPLIPEGMGQYYWSRTDLGEMITDLSAITLDTSHETDFSGMFARWKSLIEAPALDTSNATHMGSEGGWGWGMFDGCNSLAYVPRYSTSKVVSMGRMFKDCHSLKRIPAFDCSNVTQMADMFTKCSSLEEIDMTNIGANLWLNDTALGAEALNKLFGNFKSLPAGESRQVDIRGTPGEHTCSPAIAESKGWTVLGGPGR